MTVLSSAAERFANLLKLQRDRKRAAAKDASPESETERESAITARAFLVGIAVALITKADMFAILRHVDAPWETLGWASNTVSLASAGGMQIVLGCIIMGGALGFGSQFWHDLLHLVLDTRKKMKATRREALDG